MVMSEMEALADWRSQVVRQCLFAETRGARADVVVPSVILDWCVNAAAHKTVDQKIADRLVQTRDEVKNTTQAMLDHCTSGQALTLALYDAFEHQVEAYTLQIRRLQQDLENSSTSVDAVTGLRTVTGMYADIKREQDRFDRKGTSFSISYIQIDGLAELQQKYDRRGMDLVYAGVGRMISATVRSFDDAYYLGKGEYVVVLKHVDFLDACSAMDRLRHQIADNPIFMPGGENLPVTASLGIAEVIQGEKVDTCVENAKTAMRQAGEAGGNRVTEFRERSALEQLARDISRQGS
jgi:diguanylate cyclase (GGDEF)-like protein